MHFKLLFSIYIFLSYFSVYHFLPSRLTIMIGCFSFSWFQSWFFCYWILDSAISFKLFQSILEIKFINFFICPIGFLIASHLLLVPCYLIINVLDSLINIIKILLSILMIAFILLVFFNRFSKIRISFIFLSLFYILTFFHFFRMRSWRKLCVNSFEMFFRSMIAIFVLKFLKSIYSLALF